MVGYNRPPLPGWTPAPIPITKCTSTHAEPPRPPLAELAAFLRGWRGYFGFCETPRVLLYLTRWVRLRLRSALWRQWKTPRRRRAALIALRVSPRRRPIPPGVVSD